MNEMKVFENPAFGQVRTVQKDGEPWFVAADVCRALELPDTHKAVGRLDDDEKGRNSIPTLGGMQEMTIVNEPGLYTLVLGSRKPEAKAFKRWITHEVIPAIRKTGGYIATSGDETPEQIMARALVVAQETLERHKRQLEDIRQKVEADAPRVLFAQSVESSQSEILIGELAKILKQNGMDIGQNRLFEQLRKDGYLISRKGTDWNMPTQRSMDMGLMKIKETCVTHADGHVTVSKTPKITGKGQVYFVNRYRTRRLDEACV